MTRKFLDMELPNTPAANAARFFMKIEIVRDAVLGTARQATEHLLDDGEFLTGLIYLVAITLAELEKPDHIRALAIRVLTETTAKSAKNICEGIAKCDEAYEEALATIEMARESTKQ